MPNLIGDVFGLNDVYERQTTEVDVAVVEVNPVPATVFTEINAKSNLWSNLDTYGWFGGGYVPSLASVVSTVDRIDFSNDSSTASVRGPLGTLPGYQANVATGNSNYGWFGGGELNGNTVSKVDRIDFSNDFATASTRGPLTAVRGYMGATGNTNYGWFGAGAVPQGASQQSVSTVERIDFSNDSAVASPRGPLSLARTNLCATGNSDYGWFSTGIITPGALPTTVDRIDFSNDSVAALARSPFQVSRHVFGATGNSNYGWFGGGLIPGTPLTVISRVERIDFANDLSAQSVRSPLSIARYNITATGNSNYGWWSSGSLAAGVSVSTVDRIDFSNDSTTASIRGPLSIARAIKGSVSGQAKSSSIPQQKTGSYGYFGGSAAGAPLSSVERIDFSNDSARATARGPLSSGRYELVATGNSDYGWFATGRSGAISTNVSTVERIDFSNDSVPTSIRGPLNIERFYTAGATSNSNYGWVGGGNNAVVPGSLSSVERINFSNDSVIASVRGSLYSTQGRAFFAATGNYDYGWFGGGSPGVHISTIERIQYSNDLTTALQRTPLSATRYKSAAAGNSNYGWWGAGCTQSPQIVNSIVDRIDFSNDSLNSLVRGPLTLLRCALAAAGNSNYGWFGGGNEPNIPVNYSTVDRIDFANDSTTLSLRGSLSNIRRSPGATSNSPLG